MNQLSKILLGFLIVAVITVVWYLLTRKQSSCGGCSGDCASCGVRCEHRDKKE